MAKHQRVEPDDPADDVAYDDAAGNCKMYFDEPPKCRTRPAPGTEWCDFRD
jgi:hypothetical protein